MSLKHNTAWNLAGNGLPFLLGVFAIPFLIRHIGIEAFGILTLIWALIGYFSLFDFGLGRALTQQLASRLASNDRENIPHLVKSGLLFTAVTGLVGGTLLILLSQPLAHDWLKVSLSLQHETSYCFIISAIGIPLTTVTTGLRGVLEAFEDFKSVNLIRLGLGFANFGLPVLSVYLFGSSLVWIVVSLIATRIVVLMIHVELVNRKFDHGWWRSKSSSADIKNLLSFGIWMTLTNVLGPLMVTADRFVISAMLGTAAVAFYTVPFEVLIRILILPAALSTTLFPRLAAQFSIDTEKASQLYRRALQIVALLLGPICIAIAAGSYWGLSIWLGDTFAGKSWLIVVVLSAGIFFNGVAFIPFATIQANGHAKRTALLHSIEILLYVPCLFLGLHAWGINGAAIVWTCRSGLDLLCLIILAKKEFSSR